MSAVTLKLLLCDGSMDRNCENTFAEGDASDLTIREQRKKAFSEGWTRDGRKDYCKSCSEKIQKGEADAIVT